jgi:hypothetical protein
MFDSETLGPYKSLKIMFGLNSLVLCELLLHVHISKPEEMARKHCGAGVPSLGKDTFQLTPAPLTTMVFTLLGLALVLQGLLVIAPNISCTLGRL